MKKSLKKIWVIFINVILGALILIGLFLLVSFLPLKNNYKILAVTSRSMEPKIRVGSIVVSQPMNNYRVGDIITFNSGATKKDNTTHRIVKVNNKNGAISYTTKGDANKSADSVQAQLSKVVGKEIFTIPLLGYLLVYIKTLPGLILLIVIPGTIIIYEEVKKIGREMRAIKSKKKLTKSPKKEKK